MSLAGVMGRPPGQPVLQRLWGSERDIPRRLAEDNLDSSRSKMALLSPRPVEEGFGVARSNLGSALFHAVLTYRITKVKFLLGNGHVSVNIKNDCGHNLLMTALFISEDIRRDRMFRYLLRQGVNCCYRHKASGRDVLGMACAMGRSVQVRVTLESALGEIDLVHPDREGLTPLHMAVQEGHGDVVRLLIATMYKYRLSVDVVDKHGLTPYMYARRLGRPDIAHILVDQGHACVHRADHFTFRKADDWAIVGAKEEMTRQKQQLNQQVAYYRIRGMLPPINELRELQKHPPKIMLNDIEEGKVSNDKINSGPTPNGSQSSMNTISEWHTTQDSQNGSNGMLSNSGLHPLDDKSTLNDNSSPRRRRVSSLLSLNHQIKKQSGQHAGVLSKSVDTAFTLLGLKAEDTMQHATHFVQSELDTTKTDEYSSAGPPGLDAMGQLTEMMEALSDQQSSAFRKVAIPITPPPVEVKKKKQRKKVSTLAILMAKERKQRMPSRKSNILLSGKKTNKTLTDHAKEKKKKHQENRVQKSTKRKAPEAD